MLIGDRTSRKQLNTEYVQLLSSPLLRAPEKDFTQELPASWLLDLWEEKPGFSALDLWEERRDFVERDAEVAKPREVDKLSLLCALNRLDILRQEAHQTSVKDARSCSTIEQRMNSSLKVRWSATRRRTSNGERRQCYKIVNRLRESNVCRH